MFPEYKAPDTQLCWGFYLKCTFIPMWKEVQIARHFHNNLLYSNEEGNLCGSVYKVAYQSPELVWSLIPRTHMVEGEILSPASCSLTSSWLAHIHVHMHTGHDKCTVVLIHKNESIYYWVSYLMLYVKQYKDIKPWKYDLDVRWNCYTVSYFKMLISMLKTANGISFSS